MKVEHLVSNEPKSLRTVEEFMKAAGLTFESLIVLNYAAPFIFSLGMHIRPGVGVLGAFFTSNGHDLDRADEAEPEVEHVPGDEHLIIRDMGGWGGDRSHQDIGCDMKPAEGPARCWECSQRFKCNLHRQFVEGLSKEIQESLNEDHALNGSPMVTIDDLLKRPKGAAKD